MFHSNTEQLIDYWRDRRGSGSVAPRSSIDPTDFAHLLPQVFMLGRKGAGQYHFRLAGGFIAELHGRDLRGENFTRIWRDQDRTSLQLALESARRSAHPLVVETEGPCESADAERSTIKLEIMLTPLAGPDGGVDRMMGFYQPTSPVAYLRGGAVQFLAARAIRGHGGEGRAFTPHLKLASVDGRSLL
ncbi:MAG: PAS domain-containing protein [Caulobacteraceae bacterium]|nr:PAS domain-containing protein [Caulobacteraceae bacterium]